jgi:hypothetical protein
MQEWVLKSSQRWNFFCHLLHVSMLLLHNMCVLQFDPWFKGFQCVIGIC